MAVLVSHWSQCSQGKTKWPHVYNLQNKEINLTSNDQEPPQNQILPLINLFTRGRFHDVLIEIDGIQKIFPNSVLLFNIINKLKILCNNFVTFLIDFFNLIFYYTRFILAKSTLFSGLCNWEIHWKSRWIGSQWKSVVPLYLGHWGF